MADSAKHDKWHSDPNVAHAQRDGWIWDDENGWHLPTEDEKAEIEAKKSEED